MRMSELPGDLVEKILCCVPATSLKKLRSTCKQWNRLFNDRSFTRKHFEKAEKQFLIIMLLGFRVCSMSVNLHGTPSVKATGELSLIDPCSSSSDQFVIDYVFHCDGLLLCTDNDYENTVIVVWNPCTGQTRWIQPSNPDSRSRNEVFYALGSAGSNSYKILSYGYNQDLQIYELNSDSWRNLHVTLDYDLVRIDLGVSLKGKTYWFASDGKGKGRGLGLFLVRFDYTREKFERLPSQCPIGMGYQTVALSVVGDEKLSVLLQREYNSKLEIWLTNNIDDETKPVSWSKLLALDLNPFFLQISDNVTFLVDEEKKVLVRCDRYLSNDKNIVHIVGEDNRVTQKIFGVVIAWPFLFNYVPSLTQIHHSLGGKRKRGD